MRGFPNMQENQIAAVSETGQLSPEPDVSVIIPALNEEKVIGNCLEALRKMDAASVTFEVIIVDNGSTDRTAQIVNRFSTSLNLRVLEKRGVHISALRNLGASQAQGEILAFLDADCLVPSNWLIQALKHLGEDNQSIVGARYRIPERSSWIARTWSQQRETKRRELVSYVPSGDLILSRSNFFEIGGFDEQLETNEDYEFCQRARAKCLQIIACPEIAVVHLGTPQSLVDFYRKHRWHGNHVLRVFLRDHQHRQNARAIGYTSYILTGLAVTSLGLIALCFGRPMLFEIALSATAVAPILLSLIDIAKGQPWRKFGRLVLLYFIFGIARCTSLLDRRNWQSVKAPTKAA
jgi:glycosyltransferase involved in cell wall biosynthesis